MAREHQPWPSGWPGLQLDLEKKKKRNLPSSHELMFLANTVVYKFQTTFY